MKKNIFSTIIAAALIFLSCSKLWAATSVQYSYDALGRLTGVQYDRNELSGSINYTYDSVGNIDLLAVGATAPAGDIDFDGSVGLKDAILALQALSGQNIPELNLAADVNSDSKIGLSEAIYSIIHATAE